MKAASNALIALINSGKFDFWELYTFTLQGGGVLRYTTAHFPISHGGQPYNSNGTQISLASRSRGHWKVGLDVDQWTVSLSPRLAHPITGALYPDKIGVQPFLAAVGGGVLDGADVTIDRAFFNKGSPTYPIARHGAVPVGTLIIFRGAVSTCSISDTSAEVTVNDIRQLLTIQMPRNIYQASCEHVLFDAGCKLNAAAYERTANVTSVASRSQFTAAPGAPAPGSGTWVLGRVRANTGQNAGFWRSIRDWDGATTFFLLAPFPFPLAAGDNLSFWPGCAKTMAACAAFGNIINFGGEPFIPPPETASL